MNGNPPPVPNAKSSGLATASLVFGILGMTCILPVVGAITALICGIIALSQINKSAGLIKGHGQALAGTILGGVGLIMIPIVAALLLPAFVQARSSAQKVVCAAQMKSLANACLNYANSHQGVLPKSFDDIATQAGGASNLQRLLHCPTSSDKQTPSYQLVAAGKGLSELSPTDPMIVEIPTDHRGRGVNIAYGDGSVKWVPTATK